ncbi:MAG: response regulator [Desulfobacterales bacterium]|nr:response regulator [Desulfobacterales bacterium]
MSILVVDDSPNQRQLLQLYLKKGGFPDVIYTGSADESFEQLRLSDPDYKTDIDLILMDIMMPEKDGIEACRLIKNAEHLRDIPIIMVSGISELKNLEKAFGAGAMDYITKPVNKSDLLVRVRSALKLKHETDARKAREHELTEMTRQLKEMNKELGHTNKKIMDSIRYARTIQNSLLPNSDNVKACLPNSFFIWLPRDVVGGDLFHVDSFKDGIIIAVLDCTGHGVPGAFTTMIASSGLRRITRTEECYDPAEILKRLNFIVKTSLQQDTEYAYSDDGLDAAICFVADRQLIFAGARLPLFYIRNDELIVIKGDRHSIGYKRSDLNFNFTNHIIRIEKGMSFYMSTDGFTDQPGGERMKRLGTPRFRELLKENALLSFEKQEKLLIRAFEEFRGEYERVDDVTVAGFGF